MSEEGWLASIDPRTVAIDTALREIEHELHCRLDPIERVAITAALERLGDEWAHHTPRQREPW